MGFEQLDIWNRALDRALMYVDTSGETPKAVFDGYIHVACCEPGTDEISDSVSERLAKMHFPIKLGGVDFQEESLFNLLYGAAFQFKCGVKVLCANEDVTVEYEELMENGEAIDQIATMAPYSFGRIAYKKFFKVFKKQKLFFSTPLGDDTDGNPQFYLLSTEGDENSYYPAFLSMEHLAEYFDSIKRDGYMVFDGTLKELIKMNRNAFKGMPIPGIGIEPMYPVAAKIPPGEL
jgi:hypothetical protein